MLDRPDLDTLERDSFDTAKIRAALPSLLADARKVETLREALAKLDAEIVRMEDVYEQHVRADDFGRILQADAHLNGLKFARAALEGEPGE